MALTGSGFSPIGEDGTDITDGGGGLKRVGWMGLTDSESLMIGTDGRDAGVG